MYLNYIYTCMYTCNMQLFIDFVTYVYRFRFGVEETFKIFVQYVCIRDKHEEF